MVSFLTVIAFPTAETVAASIYSDPRHFRNENQPRLPQYGQEKSPFHPEHLHYTEHKGGPPALQVKILSEKIVSALDKLQLSEVKIGLEATSIYGDSLVYALREDGKLGRYQRHIHVLNPKQVRKFKDAYSDLPKNDYVDAFVIADHLRFGRIASEVYMDDYRYRSL